MGTANLAIIDSDGHIIERDTELFEYLEAPYRGNNTVLGYPFFPTLDGFQRGAIMSRLGIHKEFTINAKVWLNFLDEVGIESTVLYPTAGLAYGLIQDPDWAVAVTRAYNNWIHDRYLQEDPRLRAMALIPLQDVAEAVKELRRAVTELHMPGAVLPSNGGDLGVRKLLGDEEFWPIYEEAERLDCAIALHGGPAQGLGFNAFRRFAPAQSLEHPVAQMMQLTSMVYEGVFERFAKLRVAFLEAGTGWVPYIMDRLDRTYEVWAAAAYKEFSPWVKKKPSAYITNGNVFFSGEGEEESLRYALERLGSHAVLYASDFPHETNVARAKLEIAELVERADISEQDITNILHDNYHRFYKL